MGGGKEGNAIEFFIITITTGGPGVGGGSCLLKKKAGLAGTTKGGGKGKISNCQEVCPRRGRQERRKRLNRRPLIGQKGEKKEKGLGTEGSCKVTLYYQ